MKNNNQQDPNQKKKIPGGFILFIIATALVIFMVQNMSSEKGARVGFSHQLEHC